MRHLLRLYVTCKTPNSTRALANIKRICEEELKGSYELEVIDVLQNPQLAEDDKIIAIPTLVKKLPTPLRRVMGDLSDREKVLLGLDIVPRNDIVQVSGRQEAAQEPEEATQQEEALA